MRDAGRPDKQSIQLLSSFFFMVMFSLFTKRALTVIDVLFFCLFHIVCADDDTCKSIETFIKTM